MNIESLQMNSRPQRFDPQRFHSGSIHSSSTVVWSTAVRSTAVQNKDSLSALSGLDRVRESFVLHLDKGKRRSGGLCMTACLTASPRYREYPGMGQGIPVHQDTSLRHDCPGKSLGVMHSDVSWPRNTPEQGNVTK